jgi:hypothetical protein
MLIRGKLYRFLVILRGAMIRVAEKAIKLALDDEFFAFTFHHTGFDTLAAGSFITTLQIYRLSTL